MAEASALDRLQERRSHKALYMMIQYSNITCAQCLKPHNPSKLYQMIPGPEIPKISKPLYAINNMSKPWPWFLLISPDWQLLRATCKPEWRQRYRLFQAGDSDSYCQLDSKLQRFPLCNERCRPVNPRQVVLSGPSIRKG